MYNLVNKETQEIIAKSLEIIDCWQVREGIAEWIEVQATQPSIQELRNTINNQYSSRLEQLLIAKNQAEANGVSTATVIARFIETQTEWKNKLLELAQNA
jgi:trans-aconitate methyltransferase